MTTPTQWQVDRGQLNHNWLQNGVLVALNHALSVSSGKVRPVDIHTALTRNIHRWRERQMELSALLNRFEEEMSPKVLFDRIPLSRCSPETRSWLLPLIHQLWLWRTEAHEKICAALDAYLKADQIFQAVDSALTRLTVTPTPTDLPAISKLLQAFIEKCKALADSISALPNQILCC